MTGRINSAHNAGAYRVNPVSQASRREAWREKPIASLPVVRTPQHAAATAQVMLGASATALFVTQALSQHLRKSAGVPDARASAYEPRFSLPPLMSVTA
ncbi:MAG TPA: hypothetical protein PL096_04190 [Micropepsaceae bacterium]|nr:hypothetical protein [Micropepsaceae bacterium]